MGAHRNATDYPVSYSNQFRCVTQRTESGSSSAVIGLAPGADLVGSHCQDFVSSLVALFRNVLESINSSNILIKEQHRMHVKVGAGDRA